MWIEALIDPIEVTAQLPVVHEKVAARRLLQTEVHGDLIVNRRCVAGQRGRDSQIS